MFRGETVIVKIPTTKYDDDRNPVTTWTEEQVSNVLVAPGITNEMSGSNRPDGVIVAFTLSFPKTFKSSLRGCEVVVREESYKVIGDPQPPTVENCPTSWWMTAEVERNDG